MKTLLNLTTAILICLTFNANANNVKIVNILKDTKNSSFDEATVKFNTNPELSRAWVELTLSEDGDEEIYEMTKKIKVEGLSYNNETQEVIYQDNNTNVVCATLVESRSWLGFSSSKLEMTGNCNLTAKKSSELVDDGFYVTKRNVLRVNLEILK